MNLRAMLLVVLVMSAACRPDVESEVKCSTKGDLSCPSGFQCGPQLVCVAGESAPKISVTQPVPDAVLSGAVATKFELKASSPRGLDAITLELVRVSDNARTTLTPTVTYDGDAKVEAVIKADLEHWKLEDGAYDLIAGVKALSGDLTPVQAKVRFTIAVGSPIVEIKSPASAASITAAKLEVSVHASSIRGLGEGHVDLVKTGSDEVVLAGTLVPAMTAPVEAKEINTVASFDVSTIADGSYEIRASVKPGTTAAAAGTLRQPITIALGPPVVTIVSVQAAEVVSGGLLASASITSKRPVTGASATVTSLSGGPAITPGQAILTENGLATFFPTWTVADGAYRLKVEATTATDPVKGTATVDFSILNPPPAIELSAPTADLFVRDALAVKSLVTVAAPITAIEAKVTSGTSSKSTTRGPIESPAEPQAVDLDVDLAGLADGDATLSLRVDMAGGKTTTVTRGIKLENARLAVATKGATTSSKTVGGILTVEYNKDLVSTPIVTPTNNWAFAPKAGTGPRRFEWTMTPSPTPGANDTVSVKATDRFGDQVSATVSLPVDLAPPVVQGDVTLEAQLGGAWTLRFTCAEAASYKVKGTTTLAGTCAEGVEVAVAPRSGVVPSVELSDAVGNTAAYPVTRRVDELDTQIYTGVTKRAGGVTFAPTISASPVGIGATLKAADGTSLESAVNVNSDPSMPAIARDGALRRGGPSTSRPVVFDEASGKLRFGLVESNSGNDQFTLHTVDPVTLDPRLTAVMQINGRMRPSWDAARRAFVIRQSGGDKLRWQGVIGNTIAEVTLPIPSGDLSSEMDSMVCGSTTFVGFAGTSGNRLRTVVIDWPAGNAQPSTPRIVESADVSNMFASPYNTRLMCLSGTPTALVAASQWQIFSYSATGGGSWAVRTFPSTPAPPSTFNRDGYLASSDGLFGGGSMAASAGNPDLYELTSTGFTTVFVTGAPPRSGGAYARVGGVTYVVGGRESGAPQLPSFVAASTNGFANRASAGRPTDYIPDSAVAWDSDRRRLVAAQGVNTTAAQPALYEWAETSGSWSVLGPIGAPGVNNLQAAYLPLQKKTLVGGGTAFTGGASQAWSLWDGTSASVSASGASPIYASCASNVLDTVFCPGYDSSSVRSPTGTRVVSGVQFDSQFAGSVPGSGAWIAMTASSPKRLVSVTDVGGTVPATSDILSFGSESLLTIGAYLPWRSGVVMRGMTQTSQLVTASSQNSLAAPPFGRRFFIDPVAPRRVLMLSNAGTSDEPPLLELSDDPLAAIAIAIPSARPGSLRVELCAADRAATDQPDVRLEVASDSTIEPVTVTPVPVTTGAGNVCAKYVLDSPPVNGVLLLTTKSTGTDRRLRLDSLRMTTTYAP